MDVHQERDEKSYLRGGIRSRRTDAMVSTIRKSILSCPNRDSSSKHFTEEATKSQNTKVQLLHAWINDEEDLEI